MKRLTVLLAAVVLAGCQDHSPTGVEARSAPANVARHASMGVEQQNAQLAIDDAVDRLVPALSDAGSARQVGAALKGLRQALVSGNAADCQALASAADRAVQSYARFGSQDAALVDAIRLALGGLAGN